MTAQSTFSRRADCCVLCGRTAIGLPVDHGCKPNLSPDDMAQLRRGPLYRWDDLWRQKEVRPALTLASGQDPLKGSPQSRLLGLLRTVNNAQTGQRNSTLHWAACRLGEMLTAGELPEARHAIDNLTTVALAIGLPLREANATIRSGLSASGVTSWDSQTQS